MELAKVIGQVVSTVRCPGLPYNSLLLVDLLFDRSRDRLLHDLGTGAGVRRLDLDVRRRKLRVLLDRKTLEGRGPDEHHQDRDDHGHDGPADEEFGHGALLARFRGEVGPDRYERRTRSQLLSALDQDLVAGPQARVDDPE